MPAIDEICLPPAWRAADLWPAVAHSARQWLARRSLAARDTVLLLPFAALLAPARAALAAAGGWQIRVETPLTLAAALGPPVLPEPGQCSGEWVLDQLAARALLQRQPWGQAWAARDGAGFERIVAAVVQAAQALRSAASERAPAARAEFWRQARAAVGEGPVAGPAGTEALLLRVALEWAALAAPAATESLFSWQPAAWIVLRLGGEDAVAEALLAHAGIPSLRLLADPPPDEMFTAVCGATRVERLLCDDFEAEAMAAATSVITAVNDRRTPVALVALDRALVRRVRALLERERVPLIDETGWLLATTRAAAAVVGLLRAAQPGASRDVMLDWLKGWPGAAGPAVDALEALWRGRRHVPDRATADHLWLRAQEHLRPLSSAGSQTLARWLGLLHERLAADGSLDRLAADAAGAQVLAALRLQGSAGAAWQQAASAVRLDLPGLVAWVESTLEQAPFLPPPDAAAEVVLTPLARVFGRLFGHIVMPGADHRRLGAAEARPSLIGDALATALGLDHAAARRQRQRLALAHTLRAGGVTLLRRHRDAEEPLAESPDVEWLLLSRACSGAPAWPLQAWRPANRRVPPQPVTLPRPSAAAALPELLSASQLEALRQCPYRFFARAVLRLDEPEELDADLAKRDYGTWLHAVLHRFHSTRVPAADAHACLQAAADAVTLEQALDAGELLPYRASFETVVPAYLSWLAAREARGWHWADGESDHRLAPPELGGLRLRGRIDRLDHGPAGASQLLDYKTGSADALARKVKQPLEDTQLAFYAALLGGGEDLAAAYLALDDANAPREIAHPDVHVSAAALLHGLGQEWQRLQQGAAMPALGEGRVCETCEARGLCRRDHWSSP